MATPLCKSSVLKFYKEIIGDVIHGVEEMFTEEGIDGEILQQLRQTWEAKLMASKAVDTRSDIERQTEEKLKEIAKLPQQRVLQQQVVQQVPINNPVQQQQQQVSQTVDTKMVPIQIKLPSQPGINVPPQVLTVQIPAAALQANQLQQVLTGSLIANLMGLPQNVACNVLQQHINNAFSQQPAIPKMMQGDAQFDSSDDEGESTSSSKHILEVSMRRVKQKKSAGKNVLLANSSDGPSDISSESSEDDIDEAVSDDGTAISEHSTMEGVEEEPLNSEDDEEEDDDQTALANVDDIIVAQFDKVSRKRNKWRFYLRYGIMNLDGTDYIFERMTGEAEW